MRHFWFPFFWALSILFLCALGADDLPSVRFPDFFNFDKCVHAIMFGVLSMSLLIALRRQSRYQTLRKKALLISCCFAISYGVAIEILQYFLATGRIAEFQDIFANTVGCVLGICFFRLVYGKALFRAS